MHACLNSSVRCFWSPLNPRVTSVALTPNQPSDNSGSHKTTWALEAVRPVEHLRVTLEQLRMSVVGRCGDQAGFDDAGMPPEV